MPLEGELIYVAIIMQIGTIISILVWSNASLNKYFKKENFKIGVANTKALNRLDLRKLEKEMGLTKTKDILPTEKPGLLGSLGDLLPLLKGLEPEQISALADRFLGGSEAPLEAGGGGGNVTDMLMNFATKNPEMVQDILGGISSGYKEGGASVGGSTDGFIAQG